MSENGDTRLGPGDAAPDFELPTADGGTLSLKSLLKKGQRVVLYAYPNAAIGHRKI